MSKPLLNKCPECRHTYRLGRESTLRVYLWQEIINYLKTKCPRCQLERTVWELDRQQVNDLLDGRDNNSVTIVFEAFASDRTWQLFCAATGRRYPSRPRFTAAEAKKVENEVKFMRHLLETGQLP